MKKLLAALAIVSMAFGVYACDDNDGGNTNQGKTDNNNQSNNGNNNQGQNGNNNQGQNGNNNQGQNGSNDQGQNGNNNQGQNGNNNQGNEESTESMLGKPCEITADSICDGNTVLVCDHDYDQGKNAWRLMNDCGERVCIKKTVTDNEGTLHEDASCFETCTTENEKRDVCMNSFYFKDSEICTKTEKGLIWDYSDSIIDKTSCSEDGSSSCCNQNGNNGNETSTDPKIGNPCNDQTDSFYCDGNQLLMCGYGYDDTGKSSWRLMKDCGGDVCDQVTRVDQSDGTSYEDVFCYETCTKENEKRDKCINANSYYKNGEICTKSKKGLVWTYGDSNETVKCSENDPSSCCNKTVAAGDPCQLSESILDDYTCDGNTLLKCDEGTLKWVVDKNCSANQKCLTLAVYDDYTDTRCYDVCDKVGARKDYCKDEEEYGMFYVTNGLYCNSQKVWEYVWSSSEIEDDTGDVIECAKNGNSVCCK